MQQRSWPALTLCLPWPSEELSPVQQEALRTMVAGCLNSTHVGCIAVGFIPAHSQEGLE
jgi:hypothetical protein